MSTLITQWDAGRPSMHGTLPNHLTRSFRLTSGPVQPAWFRPQDSILEVKTQLSCAAAGSFIVTLNTEKNAAAVSSMNASKYNLFYVGGNGFIQTETIHQDENGVYASKTGKRFRDLPAFVRYYSSVETEDADIREFLDVRLQLPTRGLDDAGWSSPITDKNQPKHDHDSFQDNKSATSLADRDTRSVDVDETTLRDVSQVILSWTTRDVAVWLDAIQLHHLTPFLPTVDGRKLLTLTDDDLKGFGIVDDADIQLVLNARHELLGARRRRIRKKKAATKAHVHPQSTTKDKANSEPATTSTTFDPLRMPWHDRLPKPDVKITAPRVRRKFAVRQNVRDGRMVVQDVETGEVIHRLSPALAARITSIKKPQKGATTEVEAERDLLLKLMGMRTAGKQEQYATSHASSNGGRGFWGSSEYMNEDAPRLPAHSHDRFASHYHHHHHTTTSHVPDSGGLTEELQHAMVQRMHQGKADLPVLNDDVSVAESDDASSVASAESTGNAKPSIRQHVIAGWNPDFQRATGAGLSHDGSLLPSVLHSVSKAYELRMEAGGDDSWRNALAKFASNGESVPPAPAVRMQSRSTQEPEEGMSSARLPVHEDSAARNAADNIRRAPIVAVPEMVQPPLQDVRTHPNRVSMKSIHSSELDDTRANDDLFYEDFLESALNASEPGNLRLYSPRHAPTSLYLPTSRPVSAAGDTTLFSREKDSLRSSAVSRDVPSDASTGTARAASAHRSGNPMTSLTVVAPRDANPVDLLAGAHDGEFVQQPHQLSLVCNGSVVTFPLVHDDTRGCVHLSHSTVFFATMADLVAYYQDPHFLALAKSAGKPPDLPLPLARVRESKA
eukprot:m.834086 g.834086  ORF g.834086 m.834086 type:complete len:841 (-) comp23443_c0_seq5:1735-4257(-)